MCSVEAVSHLRRSGFSLRFFPALPGWANLCRAYGAVGAAPARKEVRSPARTTAKAGGLKTAATTSTAMLYWHNRGAQPEACATKTGPGASNSRANSTAPAGRRPLQIQNQPQLQRLAQRFDALRYCALAAVSVTRVWSVIQFTSQVWPPSSEKDCSK